MNALKLVLLVIFAIKLVCGSNSIQPEHKSRVKRFCCGAFNVPDPNSGEYFITSTSFSNQSFSYATGNLSLMHRNNDSSQIYLEINRDQFYEGSNYIGFGVTFTDSDLSLLRRMPPKLRQCVLKSYFSLNGLQFNLLKVQVDNDIDFKHKLYIKTQIDKAFHRNIKVFAELMQSPSSMESRKKAEKLSASLLKVIRSSQRKEIFSILLDKLGSSPNAMDQATYLEELLSALNKTENLSAEISLMDNTKSINTPWMAQLEENRADILDQIDIICLNNESMPLDVLCRSYKKYEKPILFMKTTSSRLSSTIAELWLRAEELIDRLMLLLNQNINGYFENSLISLANSSSVSDSLLLVNEEFFEINKQPAFHVMSHISRHLLPGSIRIDATFCGPIDTKIQALAYLRSDDKIIVLIYNKADQPIRITLSEKELGGISVTLKPKSISTIVYAI